MNLSEANSSWWTVPDSNPPSLYRATDGQAGDPLVVELMGVKPTTSCMPYKRSNQLSYSPIPIRIADNLYLIKLYWVYEYFYSIFRRHRYGDRF